MEPVVSQSQAQRLAGKEEEKRQRQIKKLESRIEELEEKIDELKKELCKPEYASDYEKLADIQKEIDEHENELIESMEMWELQLGGSREAGGTNEG